MAASHDSLEQQQQIYFFFPLLCFPLPSWLTKNSAALQVQSEIECRWTNNSLFQLNIWKSPYMSVGCNVAVTFTLSSPSFPKCLIFSDVCMYVGKCRSMLFSIFFESGDKINRLQQKNWGHTLLFVISSLESLLPLLKKRSVQTTLFFMSNARQMWPTCGESQCSLCASTVFCLIAFSYCIVTYLI